MNDDVMAVAQSAALEARAAVTQIFAHERDCERRYQETSAQMERMNSKLDELVRQGGIATGRAERNRDLLGGIPNAFWALIISTVGGGVVAAVVFFLKGMKP